MRKLYVLFNRPKLSKSEIKSFENFDDVLRRLHKSNISVLKKPLFWSASGLACFSLCFLLSLTFKDEVDKKNIDKSKTSNALPADTECFLDKIKNLKEKNEIFTFKVETEQNIVLKNGSEIEVSKNSLLTKSDDEITLVANEYLSPYTVFTSGIEMDYKDKHAFESAGMIEIHAYQNNKLVEINPKSPIKVKLKCIKNPEYFEFWKWNKEKKSWVSYPKEIDSNHDLSEYKSLKYKVKNLKSEISNVENEIINSKDIKREDYKLSNDKQQFNISYNSDDFPELEHLKNIVFEVDEKGSYDKNFTKRKWTSISLDRVHNNYIMKLKNDNEKLDIIVRPILTGNDKENAEKDFANALLKIKEEKKKNKIKLEKLKHELKLNESKIDILENKLKIKNDKTEQFSSDILKHKSNQKTSEIINNTQNFQITTWGIFNSDNPIPYPEQFENECVFVCNSEIVKVKSIIVFDLKKNLRYQFGNFIHPINSFGLFANREYKIIVVGEDSKIYSSTLKNENKKLMIKKINLDLFRNDIPLDEWLKEFLHEDNKIS